MVSTSNGVAGVIAPSGVGNFGENLDFQGNTQDGLRVSNEALTAAATWPALNVPYLFDRIDIDAPWTVSPGSAFIADGSAVIEVSRDGAMNAVGSAAMPITFIGGQSITGHWRGVDLSFTNSVLNVFDFVTVSNAGSGNGTSSGNISLACNTTFPGQLTISNSTLTQSGGFGIHTSSSGCVLNVGANVTFSDNVQGDINIP